MGLYSTKRLYRRFHEGSNFENQLSVEWSSTQQDGSQIEDTLDPFYWHFRLTFVYAIFVHVVAYMYMDQVDYIYGSQELSVWIKWLKDKQKPYFSSALILYNKWQSALSQIL